MLIYCRHYAIAALMRQRMLMLPLRADMPPLRQRHAILMPPQQHAISPPRHCRAPAHTRCYYAGAYAIYDTRAAPKRDIIADVTLMLLSIRRADAAAFALRCYYALRYYIITTTDDYDIMAAIFTPDATPIATYDITGFIRQSYRCICRHALHDIYAAMPPSPYFAMMMAPPLRYAMPLRVSPLDYDDAVTPLRYADAPCRAMQERHAIPQLRHIAPAATKRRCRATRH